MNNDELENIGQMLAGEQWVGWLASQLRVNPRNVQRWRSGALQIPPGVQDEVCQMVAEMLLDHARLVSGGKAPLVCYKAFEREYWGAEVDAMIRKHLQEMVG